MLYRYVACHPDEDQGTEPSGCRCQQPERHRKEFQRYRDLEREHRRCGRTQHLGEPQHPVRDMRSGGAT
jgi:hypothetical protein